MIKMINVLNKIITAVLVPIFMLPISPVLLIKKAIYKPFELTSLEDSDYSYLADELYITAHRGVTAVAPENTIPAYEEAVRLGYYSAECDIKLTSDNVWVLAHNSDLNSRMWQLGNVEDTDFATLRTYSYKNGTNFWKYKDLKMPTLDEFLDVFVGSETRPQIEIKCDNLDLLYTVVDAVKAKGLEKTAIIISFSLDQLKVIHDYDSSIELWYLVDEVTQDNINAAKALGSNVWLSANFAKNDAQSIKLAVDNNIGVSYWTVDTVEDAKMLYDMGVRYIETDRLCK